MEEEVPLPPSSLVFNFITTKSKISLMGPRKRRTG